MSDKSEDYLEEAERFKEEAIKELERAEKEKNAILFRDACEKGWNAIIQATNALFLKKNLPLARSHWERRKRLEELERVDPIIADLGLVDRFSARDHHLHEQGFYEGILDPATVKTELKKVEMYINDIRNL
ncbi:MAG: DUF5618 family protein [archaeon]|nr:DUF5618 family protein [archaeon]